jgi:hypothetical protein
VLSLQIGATDFSTAHNYTFLTANSQVTLLNEPNPRVAIKLPNACLILLILRFITEHLFRTFYTRRVAHQGPYRSWTLGDRITAVPRLRGVQHVGLYALDVELCRVGKQ